MLRLRTFGGVVLSRNEETLTGAATQRRRLALLALLAVAREAGLPRDKLHAFLWPEVDAERARHGLNQLVYAQRRQFGVESLFLGKKTLRLNADVIWTDIAVFEEAIARGGPEEAAQVYRGPFLDGFFVPDAPNFEHWAQGQRERLARRFLAVVTQLAEAAVANGTHAQAAEWWRRAAEQDPFNSRFTSGLLQALAAAGDRQGALRYGTEYVKRLRAELQVEPDPGLGLILESLRSTPPT